MSQITTSAPIYGKTHLVLKLNLLFSLITCLASTSLASLANLPEVHLIATGGTISGGPAGSLKANDFGHLVKGIDTIAKLSSEDYVSIGSSRMTPELQFGLAKHVNKVFKERPGLAGIVVTHGTDSLEESAFFLDLLLQSSERPVVFAAAQRPPRRTDTDGPRNLLNAIRVAASKGARGLGVIVTLNDEIHSARDVRKTHSVAVNSFMSPWVGPIGYVDDENIYLMNKPARRLQLNTQNIESNISLIRLYTGSNGDQVRAATNSGQRGIVLEVFGRGNVPPKVMDAVREALSKGLTVVFTTRTGGGRIVLNDNVKRMGVVSGEDLDGLKARIVLIATLGTTIDTKTLSNYFRQLSGELTNN